MGAWTVAFTGFATAFSTSLLVVGASTSYQYGAVAQWIGVPQALGIAVMFLLFSLPLNEMSDKLNSLTISEFLGNRYKSDAIRALSALVLFVFCIGHLIVIYRGMGLAIAEIMHVPYWLAVVLSGFLAALYTAYGGQIAVARTDLVQGWIMTIGMIVLIPVAIYRAGGFNAIHSGLAAISPQLVETPGNYPMGIFLGLVVVFSLGMLGQPQLIYRAMFIEKKKDIPKIAILAFIFSLIACWISYYSGSVGRVLIPETLTNPDSTMPIMITMLFNPIVATVLMTAMCAAAMSTTDSILIMAATAVSRDIYQKLINNKASDKDIQKLTRRLTLLLGAVGAIWALKPPSWFIYLMAFVWGVWAATYLFPILYGLYWRGNKTRSINRDDISPMRYCNLENCRRPI